MSGPSIKELNRINDPVERELRGAIRRMAIKLTARALWQLVGYKIDALVETLHAEPFTGIGFYSRPPRDGKPEAVAVFAGGAKSPAIVAMRDERTRARVAGDLAEGETAIYSGTCVVLVRDGTVEIRLANGVAVPLATLADVQAIWQWLSSMTLPVTTNGTATSQAGWAGPPPALPIEPVPPVPAISGAPPQPSGTTVLRGQ